MAVGLGERLPELGQRDATGRLRRARGGTERDRWFRMRNLPGGLGPGVRRSNPPASGAPVRRLWAAATRVHKQELRLQPACVFCNLHKGPNIAGLDPVSRELTRLYDPRRDRWREHFAWQGAVLIGLTAVGRTTIEVLAINDSDVVEAREQLIPEGRFPPE